MKAVIGAVVTTALTLGLVCGASGSAERGPAQGWLYSCGGPAYPLTLFDEPAGAERQANPASRALRELIRHPNGIETLPKKGWRRGTKVGETLDFVARRPGAPSGLFEVTFERKQRGGWQYAYSSHFCTLQPKLENQAVGRWSLDPAYPRPRPDDTVIHVLVEGTYCSSGAPPIIAGPLVSSGARRLVVAIAEDPPEGDGFDCQGVPPVPYAAELGEPIGQRVLLDAHFFPFEKRADLRIGG